MQWDSFHYSHFSYYAKHILTVCCQKAQFLFRQIIEHVSSPSCSTILQTSKQHLCLWLTERKGFIWHTFQTICWHGCDASGWFWRRCPVIHQQSDPWEFFAPLIILVTGCGGKMNLGPLPGKFVAVPVNTHFLTIALTVEPKIQVGKMLQLN